MGNVVMEPVAFGRGGSTVAQDGSVEFNLGVEELDDIVAPGCYGNYDCLYAGAFLVGFGLAGLVVT